jgi:hypothetical protein
LKGISVAKSNISNISITKFGLNSNCRLLNEFQFQQFPLQLPLISNSSNENFKQTKKYPNDSSNPRDQLNFSSALARRYTNTEAALPLIFVTKRTKLSSVFVLSHMV